MKTETFREILVSRCKKRKWRLIEEKMPADRIENVG